MLIRVVAIAMLVGCAFPRAGMAEERRPRMDERRFWVLIGQARKAAPGDGTDAADRQAAALEAALAKLLPKEILAFQELLDRKMADTYRWDLWGAANLLNGGCSDDCFDYFRGWLIGRGQKVFDVRAPVSRWRKTSRLLAYVVDNRLRDGGHSARTRCHTTRGGADAGRRCCPAVRGRPG